MRYLGGPRILATEKTVTIGEQRGMQPGISFEIEIVQNLQEYQLIHNSRRTITFTRQSNEYEDTKALIL